jgi:hypothetical protein
LGGGERIVISLAFGEKAEGKMSISQRAFFPLGTKKKKLTKGMMMEK